MNFILSILLLIAFVLGSLTTLLTNKPPYYIVKIPNLKDIYKDNTNNIYKYKLKFIS